MLLLLRFVGRIGSGAWVVDPLLESGQALVISLRVLPDGIMFGRQLVVVVAGVAVAGLTISAAGAHRCRWLGRHPRGGGGTLRLLWGAVVALPLAQSQQDILPLQMLPSWRCSFWRLLVSLVGGGGDTLPLVFSFFVPGSCLCMARLLCNWNLMLEGMP